MFSFVCLCLLLPVCVCVLKIHQEKTALRCFLCWLQLTSLPHNLPLCYYLTHTPHNQSFSSLSLSLLYVHTPTNTHTSTNTPMFAPVHLSKAEERRARERWEKEVIIFCVILPSHLCPAFFQPPTGSWEINDGLSLRNSLAMIEGDVNLSAGEGRVWWSMD